MAQVICGNTMRWAPFDWLGDKDLPEQWQPVIDRLHKGDAALLDALRDWHQGHDARKAAGIAPQSQLCCQNHVLQHITWPPCNVRA